MAKSFKSLIQPKFLLAASSAHFLLCFAVKNGEQLVIQLSLVLIFFSAYFYVRGRGGTILFAGLCHQMLTTARLYSRETQAGLPTQVAEMQFF